MQRFQRIENQGIKKKSTNKTFWMNTLDYLMIPSANKQNIITIQIEYQFMNIKRVSLQILGHVGVKCNCNGIIHWF